MKLFANVRLKYLEDIVQVSGRSHVFVLSCCIFRLNHQFFGLLIATHCRFNFGFYIFEWLMPFWCNLSQNSHHMLSSSSKVLLTSFSSALCIQRTRFTSIGKAWQCGRNLMPSAVRFVKPSVSTVVKASHLIFALEFVRLSNTSR